ncbi:ABC transporter permease [Jiangella mangrovi]|uniref:Putative aldouronate transport system permease protein n=1 Tax=Jiangella mangrovi TaxID=1524084 RepID=A0A7W9GW28_9ACTN|nr:ABC transporter permease subunit [Jiangella mangrovi]MBB5791115.1 putative aldouronate transport system permease protein [Jiangella mangrovi]
MALTATRRTDRDAPPGRGSGRRGEPARPRASLRRRLWRERWMYLFIAPGLLFFVVLKYVPLLGNVIAFQDYSPFLGFGGSPWVGLANFAAMFTDPELGTALKNTLVLSLLQIVVAFPAPIALALLLNSLISTRVKRIIQSVVYLPHFIGWVIVVSIWQEVLGGGGVVSEVLQRFGAGPIDLMSNPDTFPMLVTSQVIWKEIGWGTIIFFAAITMISTQLYESAAVDGAGPWRRMWHVTLPGMSTVIVLLLILRLGTVLTVGFEQLLLQQTMVGSDAALVLDTFTYYRGVVAGDWGLATAAGLVKGVVGTLLVVAANRFAKRMGGEGIL